MNIHEKLKADYHAGARVLRLVDEETYNWMLECVPPTRQDGYNYVNSEPYIHNNAGEAVYFCCLFHDGRKWAVYGTLREYDNAGLLRLKLETELSNNG